MNPTEPDPVETPHRSVGLASRVDIEPGYRPTLIDRGSGRPVVLLHGTPFDVRAWEPMAELLDGTNRTIRFDARGHGSATNVVIGGYRQLAEDVVTVLDRLDLPDAHVIGHSWGGQVAQTVALEHPGRVNRLSLLCTRASPFPALATAAEAVRWTSSGPEDTLARWFTPAEMAERDGLAATVRSWLQHADPARWASALDMIASFDVLGRLGEITVPVDVVAAEHDVVSLPEHMAQMAEAMPHAELHRLAGAGHLAPLQQPEEIVNLLLSRS